MIDLKTGLELNMIVFHTEVITRNQPICGPIVVFVLAIRLVFIGGCSEEFLKSSEGPKVLYCARFGNKFGSGAEIGF